MMQRTMWFFAAVAGRTTTAGQHADDAAWVARASQGDETALATLYDLHSRAVYSLAVRIVGDEADAEDVLLDVFDQAWRQAGRYDARRGTVAAWLLNLARSRAIDRLRARRARPDAGAATDDVALALLPAHVADPADALAATRDAEKVRRALSELPVLQRLAIELAYFEGLTQSEIADRLEQPLGTVKTRIRNGLLKLREVLSGTAAGGTA
jgi:RNA polymerase sigma-70 factor (ECF subfamily)